MWRETALHYMTMSVSLGEELENSQNEVKSLRIAHGKQLKKHQLHAMSYKELSRANDQKVAEINDQLVIKTNELAAVRKKLDGLKKVSTNEKNVTRDLGTFLEKVINQLDSKSVGTMLAIDESGKKLEAMQARIDAASKRVLFATTLVAQKEVKLRNSKAVAEAEERMQSSREGSTSEAAQSNTDDFDSDLHCCGSGGVRLSYSSIRPEGEAFLRAVFRRLDEECAGTVSVSLLSNMLIEDDNEQAHCLSVLCQEALGNTQWHVLRRGLSRLPKERDLTWGEFLLLLVPVDEEKVKDDVPNLSVDDYESLRRAGAWGDAQWGLIPLDIERENGTEMRTLENPEVARLTRERAYLLQHIQTMERSLERRAEVIKSYFDADLRRSKLREMRLTEAASVRQAQYEKLVQRISDDNATNLDIRSQLENQVKVLSKQLEDVLDRSQEGANTRVTEVEEALRATEAKLVRMETEQNLLKKESSKKDVINKGLQRDLVRIQSSLATIASDKARLDEELERTDDQLSAVLESQARERRNWETERQELKMRGTYPSKSKLLDEEDGAVSEKEEEGDGVKGESEDVAEVLRSQMQMIRDLSYSTESSKPMRNVSNTVENQDSMTVGQVNQSDVYASHLSKLLRLAEEAISGNSE